MTHDSKLDLTQLKRNALTLCRVARLGLADGCETMIQLRRCLIVVLLKIGPLPVGTRQPSSAQ